MNNDLISRSALKEAIEEVQYTQEFCIEHQIDYSISMQMLGMVINNAPTVDIKPFASFSFDKDELNRIVEERVIEPIKNGELVVKTAERPQGEWIPVSERLPQIGEAVLCQCRANIFEVLKLTNDGWLHDNRHCYMMSFVIAWMPLPEPYKEEAENEDSN